VSPTPNAQRELVLSKRLFWVTLATASLLPLVGSMGFTWAPAAIAAVLMLLFLAASYRLTPSAVEHEDYPDLFYYLGFLLTLVALVVALVRMDPESDDLMKSVLSQFGLALSTTIVGLAVRTWLNMYRSQDSPDALQALMEEVEKAAEDLQLTFRSTAADMRTTAGQASAELADAWGGLSSVLQTSAVELTTAIGSPDTGVVGSAVSLKRALDEIAAKVTKADGSFGTLETTLTSVTVETGILGESLERSRRGVESMAQSFADTTESATQLRPTLQATGEQFVALSRAAGEVTGSHRDLLTMIQSVLATQSVLEEFSEGIESFAAAAVNVRQLVSAVEQSGAGVASLGGAARQAAADLEVFSELPEALGAAQLKKLGDAIRHQTVTIEESLRGWRLALDRLGETSDDLQVRQALASKALLDVNDDLAAGVKFLRTTLSKKGDA